ENRFSLYEVRQVVENPANAVESREISAGLEPFLKEILGSSPANAVHRVSVFIGVDISLNNRILRLAVDVICKEVTPLEADCINHELCRATSLTLNEKFSVGLGEAQRIFSIIMRGTSDNPTAPGSTRVMKSTQDFVGVKHRPAPSGCYFPSASADDFKARERLADLISSRSNRTALLPIR